MLGFPPPMFLSLLTTSTKRSHHKVIHWEAEIYSYDGFNIALKKAYVFQKMAA
jgi:hypothetical protein